MDSRATGRLRRRAAAAVIAAIASVAVLAPAASAEDGAAAMLAARNHFFGKQNVNQTTGEVAENKVILSWVGVAGMVADFHGHVVLLDSYVRRLWDRGELHTTPEELAAVHPDFIFVGHGHYDHMMDAGITAVKSGAPIVGTPEHCKTAKSYAQFNKLDPNKVRCINVLDQQSPLGTKVDLDLLSGVQITAMRHPHFPFPWQKGFIQSPLRDPGDPEWPCPPEPNLEVMPQFPSADVFFATVDGISKLLPNGEGGSILYQFRVDGLNITWHDTQGTLDEYPSMITALKSLPRTDVQLGSVAAYTRFFDCMRDPRLYMDALRTRVFVPIHDDPSDPTEPTPEFYRKPLLDEIRRIPADHRPCLHILPVPSGYIHPDELTFDPHLPVSCTTETAAVAMKATFLSERVKAEVQRKARARRKAAARKRAKARAKARAQARRKAAKRKAARRH